MQALCVVAAGAVVYQAAKLVCCQRYYRWRNDTLLKLVQWFDVDYPDQLDAAKLKEVTPLAVSVLTQGKGRSPTADEPVEHVRIAGFDLLSKLLQ